MRGPGSSPGRARRARGEDGSAVVDFLLVAVLVVFLFLVVAQLGVVLHVRTVLVAAAAEGARFGANADRTPEQGGRRAVEVVADSLSPEVAAGLRVTASTPSTAAGLRAVQVRLDAPLPVVFLPVGPLEITVRGHALEEGR